MLLVGIYTFGLTFCELHLFENVKIFKDTIVVHSLIGFAISLLMVFRTNTAYERWWEGRKEWGKLVNETRNFALKLSALLPEDRTKEKEYFSIMTANFVWSLKDALRGYIDPESLDDCENWKKEIKNAIDIPHLILHKIHLKAQFLRKEAVLTAEDMLYLDKNMNEFANVKGACERIKNTPIPFSYSLFLKKFLFVYIATLPIGLIPSFEYWTILITIFVFYFLVSMEVLAEEIEEPFGSDSNDLPTDKLAVKIKHDLNEILCRMH